MKMKSLKNLLAVFILICLTSCDPSQNINLVNNTDSEVYFKLKIEHDTKNYELKQLSQGDSIVVNVGSKKNEMLSFAIGDWSGNTVVELANSIKSFEIKTKDITTIYHSKSSIEKILKDNREGLFLKTMIEIEVSE